MAKTRQIAEYGDFQTPDKLAREVCLLLTLTGVRPAAILEPTCGLGSFLFAALESFQAVKQALGAEINAEHVKQAKKVLRQRTDARKADVVEANFFATDWTQVIAGLPEPVLVIGNLPWVTNAQLGTLGSQNLPVKSNFQNRNGFDAITGKANFDISEWMLIRLLETMHGRRGTLAMLCKASVARKALYHGWRSGIALERSAIYRIDADLHFAAAVDAALLVTHFAPRASDLTAKVYPHLRNEGTPTVIGYKNDTLLADIGAYHQWKHLRGEERLKWRSGIKHDCAKVMELRREGNRYRNGLGELVEIEDVYLYPMLKSSDVANGCGDEATRWMIVTQQTVGQDTAEIEKHSPKLWDYLNAHAGLLSKRGSSIYRNRPAFSIFGVGEYSFAPWKVAISGFYKKLAFKPIGPYRGKPVVLDDTSYFLPCRSKAQADCISDLLNSPAAQAFYRAFVFWDAKRPITADLLRRLDLRRLAEEAGTERQFDKFLGDRRTEIPLPGNQKTTCDGGRGT